MIKKTLIFSLSLSMVLILAACATSQATPQLLIDTNPTAAGTAVPAAGSGNNGQGGGFQNASLESKLAYGTLMLEGTSNAVTAAEAKTLLPLWQKVADLSSNGTPTPEDIQTVYTQIEKAMTTDQVTAITNMTMNPQEIPTLMATLGITITPGPGGFGFGNGNGNGNGNATPSADQLATRTARQTQFAGSGGNGGFSGTRTPGAFGGRGGAGFRGGFNSMFVQPLIKLLTTRASS